MEVDDSHSNDIPSVLREFVIYKCRAYDNARQYSQLILTGGQQLALYEIQHGNILCSCNLSAQGFFKGDQFISLE